MNTYKVPITYQVHGFAIIEAEDLSDLKRILQEGEEGGTPLLDFDPETTSVQEGSWKAFPDKSEMYSEDEGWVEIPEATPVEHTNISKDEAYKLMEQGRKICHEYYTDDEYLHMRDGRIFDEHGLCLGTKDDTFWNIHQRWEHGWKTFN